MILLHVLFLLLSVIAWFSGFVIGFVTGQTTRINQLEDEYTKIIKNCKKIIDGLQKKIDNEGEGWKRGEHKLSPE